MFRRHPVQWFVMFYANMLMLCLGVQAFWSFIGMWSDELPSAPYVALFITLVRSGINCEACRRTKSAVT